jgi:acylphosphatase
MVWNEDDGSVMIIAEGQERKLERFLHWAQVGPAAAKVIDKHVEWMPATGQYEQFSVRS